MSTTSFPDAGFGIVNNLFDAAEITRFIAALPELESAAGTRGLLQFDWAVALAQDPRMIRLAERLVGPDAKPIRGILFDKAPGANWNLGWHQDTIIAVETELRELEGYSAWSVKEGVTHVKPPHEILDHCVALRLHLDICRADNGALRVIPESHHLGLRPRPTEDEAGREVTLTANPGDVIWMRSLLFHASSRATNPSHRRVIHIEYCSAALPDGMTWAW